MLEISELKRRLDAKESMLLLDVRSEAEFIGDLGHIPGAVNIPIDQLANRVGELQNYTTTAIILICRTDRRSAMAEQVLRPQGFAQLEVVKGGMIDWNKRGYSVER